MNKSKIFAPITVLITLLLCFLLLEAGATIYFFGKDSRIVSLDDKRKSQENQYVKSFETPGCVWGDIIESNPFWGWNYKRSGHCASSLVNSIGMRGPEFPIKKSPREFNVLIIGGSVADIYARSGFLEKRLNELYSDRIKRYFIVLDGGVGGWGYPNQFMMFMLFANRMDAIISIDGFNEHWHLEKGGQSRIENPTMDFNLRKKIEGWSSWKRWLGQNIDARLYRAQRDFFPFNYSRFFFLASEIVRNKARDLGADQTWRLSGNSTLEDDQPTFYFPDNFSPDERRKYNFEQFLYYFEAMDAVGKTLGIPIDHFLQPVPKIGKQLTAEESKNAGNWDYVDTYQEMERQLLALKKKGSHIHSLTDLFKDESQTVYTDFIHLNDLGQKLMTERILKDVKDHWKL